MGDRQVRSPVRKAAAGREDVLFLVDRCLQNIENYRHLNAFLEVYADDARAQARHVQARMDAGEAGKLAGQVVAVKDNIAIRGRRLTCASRILQNFTSLYDATVIQRLRDADAVIIGKTNLDEFGMGSSNENSAFGPARNPHDPERVAGGSSGGSAVAVAGEMCTVALGSDTGGSVRQPAAFCGVTGLKPTYGRVSRFGLVAFASSLDQIGVIGRSARDVADVLQVIAGHDPRSSTSVREPSPDLGNIAPSDLKGKTVALPRRFASLEVQSDILIALDRMKNFLQAQGARLIEVDLPLTDYGIAAYYVICTAEASSNLARFDGARYGVRVEQVESLEEMYTRSRTEGFGREVQRRIMLGTYVLSAGYYDAYYRRAMKVRTMIRREFEKVFKTCDLLLTPTTPTTAFKIGEKVHDPIQMYLSDVFTVSANLAGLPAISVPAGRDAAGLPIGLQFIAPPFGERDLLHAALRVETSGKFH